MATSSRLSFWRFFSSSQYSLPETSRMVLTLSLSPSPDRKYWSSMTDLNFVCSVNASTGDTAALLRSIDFGVKTISGRCRSDRA